jgi:hypothetical protein
MVGLMRLPLSTGSGRIFCSGSAHETKLLERGHAIVQAALLQTSGSGA